MKLIPLKVFFQPRPSVLAWSTPLRQRRGKTWLFDRSKRMKGCPPRSKCDSFWPFDLQHQTLSPWISPRSLRVFFLNGEKVQFQLRKTDNKPRSKAKAPVAKIRTTCRSCRRNESTLLFEPTLMVHFLQRMCATLAPWSNPFWLVFFTRLAKLFCPACHTA